jgi:predicted Zn-dependent protease
MGVPCRIKMIQFLCHVLIIAVLAAPLRPARALETASAPTVRPLSDITAGLPALGEAAVDELSPAAERRLGGQVFAQLQAAGLVHDDPEATDYLTAQASQLVMAAQARGDLVASGLKPEDFRFFWVREDSINAFALPGGWIGVHTGLMTRAASEAELMSVIAHEIAHVTQRHIARQMGQSRQSMAVLLATAILAAAAASQSADAAMGLMSLGETLALRNQLAFSRDAEREADRLGYSFMQASGFDPAAMSTLFEKLSQAGRYYDDAAPVWLRTHPLSSERLSDAQLRLSQMQAPGSGPRLTLRGDSLEFLFIRARLLAQSGRDLERSRSLKTQFEVRLSEAVTAREQALAWYALAWVELALKAPDRADQALQRTRLALVSGSDATLAAPLLARLEQAIAFEQGRFERAIAVAEPVSGPWVRTVSARALARARAEALLMRGDPKRAIEALSQGARQWPADHEAWKLLARAYDADRRPAMAHWATAESYALLGAYGAAIDQIALARRAEGADFQALSEMDARLVTWRAALRALDPNEKRQSSDR